ncbi:hypothetical protein E3T54_02790 [Cryobacterium sp. Sr8]|uniref:hypothetical protein n=1 Tax=Cryobacterium sp. Sr8 TaxID=1259203 RepID=UPI00106B34C7|nr:hypothetical protein [Cryobacterium sp. Sr8]TFD80686.1 hypothetical protein E3T54_02790 [Cryobacterium sp. Sr8]
MNTPIKREDIRKGDRVRAIAEYTATVDSAPIYPHLDVTYELIERPVQLPTEPGFYLDRDGEVWNLEPSKGAGYLRPEYAPFTLLRPVAEVAAEVLRDVRGMFGTGALVHRSIDKLEAKWATK